MQRDLFGKRVASPPPKRRVGRPRKQVEDTEPEKHLELGACPVQISKSKAYRSANKRLRDELTQVKAQLAAVLSAQGKPSSDADAKVAEPEVTKVVVSEVKVADFAESEPTEPLPVEDDQPPAKRPFQPGGVGGRPKVFWPKT